MKTNTQCCNCGAPMSRHAEVCAKCKTAKGACDGKAKAKKQPTKSASQKSHPKAQGGKAGSGQKSHAKEVEL